MLAPDLIKDELPKDKAPLPGNGLAVEREFYEGYAWCLNPHLTVRKAIEHLRDEIGKLPKLPPGWQADEAVTNVYLLSCGLLNCADEYLRGPGLRLPWRLATTLLGRCARWMADNILDLRQRRRNELRQWRDLWLGALHDFLAVAVSGSATELGAFAEAGEELTSLLNATLPQELLDDRVGIPSPFRRLDMTHHDVIALGERYVERFPDRAQAILLVGLRTSGSYFRAVAARLPRQQRLCVGVAAHAVAEQGPRPHRGKRVAALRRAELHRGHRGRSAAHRRHHSHGDRDRSPRWICPGQIARTCSATPRAAKLVSAAVRRHRHLARSGAMAKAPAA